jgi:hypothetical protein
LGCEAGRKGEGSVVGEQTWWTEYPAGIERKGMLVVDDFFARGRKGNKSSDASSPRLIECALSTMRWNKSS